MKRIFPSARFYIFFCIILAILMGKYVRLADLTLHAQSLSTKSEQTAASFAPSQQPFVTPGISTGDSQIFLPAIQSQQNSISTATATHTPTPTPTITPSPTPFPTTTHCGAITSDETWTADVVHVVNCEVSVNLAVTLTIAPGAIVKFKSSTGVGSIDVSGTLMAVGSANAPLFFTSLKDDSIGGDTNGDGADSTPERGNWGGISVDTGGAAHFDHATIRYAVSNIRVTRGHLTITNSTIAFSKLDGLALIGAGVTLEPVVKNNTFTNNGAYALSVNVDNGYLTGNSPIENNSGSENGFNGIFFRVQITNTLVLSANPGLPYVIGNTGYLQIPAGQTLQFAPGTITKFFGSRLDIDGTLLANGTKDNPITFTSLRDDTIGGDTNGDGANSTADRGNWGGISIKAGSVANIDQAIIRYGVPNIRVVNGHFLLTNSVIAFSNSEGIAISAGVIFEPVIKNNTFTHNNGYAVAIQTSYLTGNRPIENNSGSNNGLNGIALKGEITGTLVLSANPGLPYVVDNTGSLTIPAGQTLQFTPGTITKFFANGINVYGTLLALGETNSLISFTSWKDDSVGGDTNGDGTTVLPVGADWNTIYIYPEGNASFEYASIRYGGSSPPHSNIVVASGGQISIINCNIEFSSEFGLVSGNHPPILAANNWWGSVTGPDPYGTGNGINYSRDPLDVDYYVDAVPWLTEPISP